MKKLINKTDALNRKKEVSKYQKDEGFQGAEFKAVAIFELSDFERGLFVEPNEWLRMSLFPSQELGAIDFKAKFFTGLTNMPKSTFFIYIKKGSFETGEIYIKSNENNLKISNCLFANTVEINLLGYSDTFQPVLQASRIGDIVNVPSLGGNGPDNPGVPPVCSGITTQRPVNNGIINILG